MKKATLIVLLCVAQLAVAQNYKFGKVSKEELLQTVDPDYPDANAAILYRSQNISFKYVQGKGFLQNNEVFERIKIYNKEGFDYATKLIRLYVNSEGSRDFDEALRGLKAVTYNLDGSKVSETKLKKEGVFEEKTNKFIETTKFTMPNIKEGSIIEFEYTIQSQRSGIDDISLQQLIPIKKLDLSVKTPEFYKYNKVLNPRASYVPVLSESKIRDHIDIVSRNRQSSMKGIYGNITNSSSSTTRVDYDIFVINAELSNIPPLKTERYVDNLSNYQAKLILEIDRVEWPNEPIQLLSSSWEKVTKTIYDNSDFGEQLNRKGYYTKDVDELLKGIVSNTDKMDLIYNFVKSKVKWNSYNGYYTDNGVAKAYKDGSGNSADINLMLVSILRYAGLDANPVLVSTKNNGIPLMPTRSGFNYVICVVKMDGANILLDASDKFSTANILPTKSLNWLGRIVRQDGTSNWIGLIPEVASKENASLNVKLNADLTASGKVRSQYTNYQAMRVRENFNNHNHEEMIAKIEKDKGEIEISNLEIQNLNVLSDAVTQTYDYNLENASEVIGDKIYFSPLLFLATTENPFKEDQRHYPIDFEYPINDKYLVNIMLPEGYEVESLPESVKFEFNDAEGQFSFIGTQNGNYLQFVMSLDLNTTLILPESYEKYKEFYQMVVEKQTEKVVLKKI